MVAANLGWRSDPSAEQQLWGWEKGLVKPGAFAFWRSAAMASDERRRGEIYLPVLCNEQNDMASCVTGSVSDIGGPRSGRDMF